MKRPWHIWSLYLLGLALVLAPMAWLTQKVLHLDIAERAASQRIQQEEKMSRALWRMDVLLMPLLAQEAVRPEFAYHPVYGASPPGGAKGVSLPTLSPLLVEPPAHVLLHFELDVHDRLSSPQSPTGPQREMALKRGLSPEKMDLAGARLAELAGQVTNTELIARLPAETLPLANWEPSANELANGQAFQNGGNNSLIVANDYPQLNSSQALQNNEPAQQQSPQQQAALPQTDNNNTAPQQAVNSLTNNFNNTGNSRKRGANGDLENRTSVFQTYAQRSLAEQRQNYGQVADSLAAIEGVSQPLWIGDKLILARRVQRAGETIVQGCWLDWQALQQMLTDEVQDLDLPKLKFSPVLAVAQPDAGHLLATLPVEVQAGPLPLDVSWRESPLRMSLLIAWIGLAVALIAAAITLQGMISLSERRGAFVSAVTHELRTPLTTFRLYAEMLAENMVTDPEQRQSYLETLQRESQRLAHLVENVLLYARLERGKPASRREQISLAAILERTEPRLTERAAQAGLKLEVQSGELDLSQTLLTDPTAVEQILFNLVDNAGKYAQSATDKRLLLVVSRGTKEFRFLLRDHGPGISSHERRSLFQPFSKSVQEAANSAPGVGLGLALSLRLAQALGGNLVCEKPAGENASSSPGATFTLSLPS